MNETDKFLKLIESKHCELKDAKISEILEPLKVALDVSPIVKLALELAFEAGRSSERATSKLISKEALRQAEGLDEF